MTAVDPLVEELMRDVSFDTPMAYRTPAELREEMRTTQRAFEGPGFRPEAVELVEDLHVKGVNGEIPVRVYSPVKDSTPAVIVYAHGGAWLAGDLDTHDKVTRRLSNGTGAVVVAVDYRLAPEHPFPAGFQDCWDSLLWASRRYPGKPLLVAGDSAGGTLAGCVALRARDDGGPELAGQVLVYPGIDDDVDTGTMHRYAGRYGISREDFTTVYGWYLTRDVDRTNPYAMPGFASSLEGLPPTVMATAGADALLAANEGYAQRLRDAGVAVEEQSHPSLIHGWLEFFPLVPAADAAFAALVTATQGLIARARGEQTGDEAGTTAGTPAA